MCVLFVYCSVLFRLWALPDTNKDDDDDVDDVIVECIDYQ